MKLQIFDIENWKEIGATLARNKTRTFLTGFGIFWGVAMLALLMGGARGAEDLLRRNFAGFATNSAFIYPNLTTMPYKGNPKDRAWQLDIIDVERIRLAIPELSTVTTTLYNNAISFRNGKFTYSGSVWGVEPEFTQVMEPVIYNGRFINATDVSLERKVAVVGKKIANEIFPNDPSPIGKFIEVNNISYKIIGIAGQTSELRLNDLIDEVVILPESTFRRSFYRGNKVDAIMIVANRGQKISQLTQRIRHILFSRHTIHPDDKNALWLLDVSEQFEQIDALFIGISILALFIGISTLLAGIIGIGNIMWVIVKERTQEIGIRRAIGAKPHDIIIQILSEGVMLTAIAGLAGICFATICLGITQTLTTNEISVPHFQMELIQALEIFLTFIILGTLAGLIPAFKAMKIKPIEALNDR